MWAYDFTRQSDLPPDALWSALIDVANWSKLDSQIVGVQISDPLSTGTEFRVRRKGQRWRRHRVTTYYPPSRFAHECPLPFAKLRKTYSFHTRTKGCDIIIRVEIFGVLAALWGELLGRKLADGLHQHASQLISQSRAQQPRSVVPVPHLGGPPIPMVCPPGTGGK